MLDRILNRNKTKVTIKVVFREEAAKYGEHGSLYANDRQRGLMNEPVPFAFVDVKEMPNLDPTILEHIWDQAKAAGYEPLCLRSYATVMTVKPAPILTFNTPRVDPQVFREQARQASKDMAKQHEAKRRADVQRDASQGKDIVGRSHHAPRVTSIAN